MVQRHLDLIASGVAARLLASWAGVQQRFVRVLPVEYAKLLATQHLDTEAARLAAI